MKVFTLPVFLVFLFVSGLSSAANLSVASKKAPVSISFKPKPVYYSTAKSVTYSIALGTSAGDIIKPIRYINANNCNGTRLFTCGCHGEPPNRCCELCCTSMAGEQIQITY